MYRASGEAGDRDASFLLGALLDDRGDLAGAEEAYRRADAAGDDDAAVNLGVLRYRLGDRLGARHAWQRGADRGQPVAWLNLAVLNVVEGDEAGGEDAREHARAAFAAGDPDVDDSAEIVGFTYPGQLMLMRVSFVELNDADAEARLMIPLNDDGSIQAD